MQILGLLGVYFDAVVVEVKKNLLLFILAITILLFESAKWKAIFRLVKLNFWKRYLVVCTLFYADFGPSLNCCGGLYIFMKMHS